MVNAPKICLLGASFSSGNLGVSALAWSSIKLIKSQWHCSDVVILGVGLQPEVVTIRLDGEEVSVETRPVRFCVNIFTPHHISKLLLAIYLTRIFHFLKRRWIENPTTLGALLSCDMIFDITGGDSFSDIYGFGRLTRGYLLKRTCQKTGKPFIMLPQTYGPFKSSLSKYMAKQILKQTRIVFSRDREGCAVIGNLIGKSEKVRLCPDVAFILEARPPVFSHDGTENMKLIMSDQYCKYKKEDSQLIGLNISGLLYNNGYTGKNEFGLKCDYRRLLLHIIDFFLGLNNTKIVLIPHVVPEGWEAENDLLACRQLRESLPEEIRRKILIAEPDSGQSFFDQCEIKYLIGQCDFFLGSRMHATIAAISQCIPAVGLAYSKKFHGVFETAGVAECVLDLRILDNKQVIDGIIKIFNQEKDVRIKLRENMPGIKTKILRIFSDLDRKIEDSQ